MADPFSRLRRFLAELKRRKVYRTAVLYGVVAFGVWQVADYLFPALGFPAWTLDFVVVLSLLGFPLVLVLAWAFEVTPEGVERTEREEEESAGGEAGGAGWMVAAVALLLFGGVVWWSTVRGGAVAPETSGSATDTGAVRDAAAAAAGPPRVAVLPFENIAPDSSDAFFAQGMHEEVLNQLAKVSGLEVISRTSVMQYAETDKPVPEISEELGGVAALLEGTVRRAGEQVRITTQLIDARRDTHLWSNTYDRELSVDAIFEIQADIAERIAGAMEAELTEAERRRIGTTPTGSMNAYEAYIRGRSQWHRSWAARDPVHVDRAVQNLRRAVAEDSTFAEARAWLGLSYAGRYGYTIERQWLDSASVAVERARELAPGSAVVFAARGAVRIFRDSLDAAELDLRRALELQPSNRLAAQAMAVLHGSQGNWTEEIRWGLRTARLDPRLESHVHEMGNSFRFVGMLDVAEAWIRYSQELSRGLYGPMEAMGELQLARGDPRAARETVSDFRQNHPEHPGALTLAGDVALRVDDFQRAKRYLERVPEARRRALPDGSPTRPEPELRSDENQIRLALADIETGNRDRGRAVVAEAVDAIRSDLAEIESGSVRQRIWLARGLAVLGNTEEALRELALAASEGYPAAQELRHDPFFEPLRSGARFREVMDRVEANQERVQDEIRRMGVGLSPPGWEAGEASRGAESSSPG